MDWLTFTSNVLASVAWPAALVILVLTFRAKVEKLIDRVQKIAGPAGTGAEFMNSLERSREEVEATSAPTGSPEPLSNSDPFLDLADRHPQAAVMSAYKDVEEAIRDSIEQGQDKGLPRTANHVQFIYRLNKVGLLPDSLHRTYLSLRETRNAAVHTRAPISQGEAVEYRDLVQRFLTALRPILDQWAGGHGEQA